MQKLRMFRRLQLTSCSIKTPPCVFPIQYNLILCSIHCTPLEMFKPVSVGKRYNMSYFWSIKIPIGPLELSKAKILTTTFFRSKSAGLSQMVFPTCHLSDILTRALSNSLKSVKRAFLQLQRFRRQMISTIQLLRKIMLM